MIDKKKPFSMGEWYPDVVKIIMSRYKNRISPHDSEDIIHEVCEALIKKSTSPNSCYNKDLASPSHYILMVADCVIKNRYHKEKKHLGTESLEELVKTTPKALSDNYSPDLFQSKQQLAKFEAFLSERDPKFVDYLKMIREGYSFKHIGGTEKINPNKIKSQLESFIQSFKDSLCPPGHSIQDDIIVTIKKIVNLGKNKPCIIGYT